MQGIKITTDNKVSVVNINANDYHEIIECIGCNFFETVKVPDLKSFFLQDAVMLVDEEGLLKNLDFNLVGSWFYGTRFHCNPIVGDLLIFGQNGPEFIGLDMIDNCLCRLLDYFPDLEEVDSDETS